MSLPCRQLEQFTPEVLQRLRTDTFVSRVEMAERVGSTSDWALSAVRETESDQPDDYPRLFLCERQTAGRGRGGNRWWSGEGALTFSLAVCTSPDRLPPERRPLLSPAIGVALADAVQAATGDSSAQLKWPNDVFLGGRKAAGILIEAPPHRRDLLVIGIGVNVSNSPESLPAELRQTATSLLEACGRHVTRPHLLYEMLRRIESAIDLVVENDPWLIERANALHLLQDRNVTLQLPQESVLGRVLRIEADGSLALQTAAGQRRFRSGTIARFE